MRSPGNTPEGDGIDVLLDYWDGPITGIVLTAQPSYYFQALFDTASDSYSGQYKITIVSDETRRLAVEVERLWKGMPENQRRGLTVPSDFTRELRQLKESIIRDTQENLSWWATARFIRDEGAQSSELEFRVIWDRSSAPRETAG
jgi:hypothetical protein